MMGRMLRPIPAQPLELGYAALSQFSRFVSL